MIDDDDESGWNFGDARRPVTAGLPVLRFRIELPLYDGYDVGAEPRRTVMRLIEVPEDYSFWDLHVAIQSAMGWLDSHLHEFQIPARGKKREVKIGLMTDSMPDDVLDDRDVRVSTYLSQLRATQGMLYWYDFGDSWRHWVTHEATLQSDGGLYPRCVAGRWACPPEDCGGDGGYFEMLEVISNPKDEDYKERREWLRAMVSLRGSWPYKPERFDPKKVKFDDPVLREAFVFGGQGY